MEIREFAKRILFSRELADKLQPETEFTDLHPFHPDVLPSAPARTEALSLGRWNSAPKVPFPSQSDLLDPVKVGVLLHFFANHELLALELMALALLKFPDAPAAFRLGVVRTMLDEQRHLRAYLERMNRVGIQFGDLAVNDFFWTQCASMRSPYEYVTRMSLTFEQANLDFASYFRDVLLSIGDTSTAELLQEVLDDEIGHVKHGLVWFRRWKPESQSDWQAFCEALGATTNPARAKGHLVTVEPRLRAGFEQDFIDSLRVFSQSKGGLPRISFFNPEAEEEIRLRGSVPQMSSLLMSAREDLAPVMMYAVHQDDIILVSRELPKSFLLTLSQCGFVLPELRVGEVDSPATVAAFAERKLGSLNPWALTPRLLKLESVWKTAQRAQSNVTAESLIEIYSKSFAHALLLDFLSVRKGDVRLLEAPDCGEVVRSPADLERVLLVLRTAGHRGKFIAKRPWSASGRHRVTDTLHAESWADLSEQTRKWFEKSWRLGEMPLVQPLFERVLDFSLQARVEGAHSSTHQTHVLGVTRILNLPNGQYAGTCVGRFLSDVDSEMMRFWHGQGDGSLQSIEELLAELAQFVGTALASRGFRGSFGIDAFICRAQDGSLKLMPMIEINPRYTMGRVALALSKRLAPGRVGLWLHVPKTWLVRLQAESFVALKRRWQEDFPLQTQTRSGGTIVLSGLLETTPAEQSQQVWTCLVVGQSLQALLAKLAVADVLLSNERLPTSGRPEQPL